MKKREIDAVIKAYNNAFDGVGVNDKKLEVKNVWGKKVYAREISDADYHILQPFLQGLVNYTFTLGVDCEVSFTEGMDCFYVKEQNGKGYLCFDNEFKLVTFVSMLNKLLGGMTQLYKKIPYESVYGKGN